MIQNWLVYRLEEQIRLFVRRAYHQSKVTIVKTFKALYNHSVARQVKVVMHRLKDEEKVNKFDDIVAFGRILCKKKGNLQHNKEIFGYVTRVKVFIYPNVGICRHRLAV